jgi:hypothetical protein
LFNPDVAFMKHESANILVRVVGLDKNSKQIHFI